MCNIKHNFLFVKARRNKMGCPNVHLYKGHKTFNMRSLGYFIAG